MLKFPCICGKNFALENDQAGSEFQCPACGRLVIAPTLDEIDAFAKDGTYAVEERALPTEEGRLEELRRSFTKHRVDESGAEIDLRPTLEDFLRVGDQPGDPEVVAGEEPPAKRLQYDPETGELVEPLDIKEDEPLTALPVEVMPAAKPSLGYARGVNRPGITPWRIPIELLMPQNLVVLLFILFFHMFLVVALGMAAMGYIVSITIAVVIFFSVAGQYALVVEETGPEQKDEIPRPMRWFSFGEDIWRPFVVTMMALGYSFAPAIVVNDLVGRAMMPLWVALYVGGALIFPAVLLVTTTSEMLNNLRPDRVLGVIAVAGLNYWAAAGAMVTGMVIYVVGLIASGVGAYHFLSGHRVDLPAILTNGALGLPELFVGIYMLHLGAWYLGLIWRQHHAEFPWVGQRWERTSPGQQKEEVEAAKEQARMERDARQIKGQKARAQARQERLEGRGR